MLALERVRLLATAGEPLTRPDSGTLRRHAAVLRRLGAGQRPDDGLQLCKRAGELEAIAEQPQPEHEARERAAQEERARAAATQQERQQQDPLANPSSGTVQPAPELGAAQGGVAPSHLAAPSHPAARLPSVARALQQAASLPQGGPLRGVRFVEQKYLIVRVSSWGGPALQPAWPHLAAMLFQAC